MIDTKVVVSSFKAMRVAFEAIAQGKALAAEQRRRRVAAIDSVRQAALATKAYLYDTEIRGQPSDRSREAELAQHWRAAGTAMEAYDQRLYNIANLKALGWSDPREWDNVKISPEKLKVDVLLQQCDWLLAHPDEPSPI